MREDSFSIPCKESVDLETFNKVELVSEVLYPEHTAQPFWK